MKLLARNVGVHCLEHHSVALDRCLSRESIADDERFEMPSVPGDCYVRTRQRSFNKGLYLFRFHAVGACAKEYGLSGSAPALCYWGTRDCASNPRVAGELQ